MDTPEPTLFPLFPRNDAERKRLLAWQLVHPISEIAPLTPEQRQREWDYYHPA